jgi:predicted glycosyl hydrolase (DUF1957 family)
LFSKNNIAPNALPLLLSPQFAKWPALLCFNPSTDLAHIERDLGDEPNGILLTEVAFKKAVPFNDMAFVDTNDRSLVKTPA